MARSDQPDAAAPASAHRPARDLAEMLTELRLARAMSQEELADRSGVSIRAISDLERGVTRRPHRDTVRALAGALRLDPAQSRSLDRLSRTVPPPSRPRSRAPRITVPAPVTSIIGRDADLAAVGRLVRARSVRLVCITGPGGVGKTRLATEVAWRGARGMERVDAVDLSVLDSGQDLLTAIVTVLGIRGSSGRPMETIAARMGRARWLLLAESFEHVPDAAATLADLLATCQGLTLLVTSRVPVRLRGEHLWPLDPLPLPPLTDATTSGHDPAVIATNPAVCLLVERAAAVRPGFSITPANATDLVRLCHRLGGLPLAIELAAAHLRTLAPATLLADLVSRLPDLASDEVDVAERHQTMRATVLWGIDHLPAEAREVFRILGAFTGGASPDALATVAAAADRPLLSPDASLAVLAASHLVTMTDHAGSARIAMLDPVHEVAAELLGSEPDGETVRDAHGRHFLDALRTVQSIDAAPGVVAADWLDPDLGNVRVALARTMTHHPETLDAELVRGLMRFFVARDDYGEAYRTLSAAAEAAVSPSARAWSLHMAGIAANEYGEPETAVRMARGAETILAELGDDRGRCSTLILLGNALRVLGRIEEARQNWLIALDVATALGDEHSLGVVHHNLGVFAQDVCDYDRAREHYQASLELKRRRGDRRGVATTTMNLGSITLDTGDPERARQIFEGLLAELRAMDARHQLGFTFAHLAEALLALGDVEGAASAAEQGLTISRKVEYGQGVAFALRTLGSLALRRGDTREAQRLHREALGLTSDAQDTVGILERLAAACLDDDPEEARQLLLDAEQTRRERRTPVPPADRAAVTTLRVRVGLPPEPDDAPPATP
ncbi:MAG: tetratricopeptide repeat protein [Actinomycetales bacterium]|nr:tetratricopeptide repeat protein [Actinomycetales bacterium]